VVHQTRKGGVFAGIVMADDPGWAGHDGAALLPRIAG